MYLSAILVEKSGMIPRVRIRAKAKTGVNIRKMNKVQKNLNKKNKTSGKISGWVRLIEAVTTPLGFYVLALLIVEAFLATVLVGGNLQSDQQMTGVWAGIILFVLVISAVFLLDWYKPKNLTFDKDAHLSEQELRFRYYKIR